MQSLQYIELDIPFCSLTYGVAPCTASIPTTGDIKCFNSRNTCQDIDNFTPADVTLRFAKPTDYLPVDIECIPSISEVSFTPATISLGENLGTRATLSVTFKDHPHSDTGEGFDKYLADRDYDPYSQGTFWGKFRARQPFVRGQALRWITGLVGDDLADMETRHFIVDSFDGPTPDGKYTIVAKDVLKLADGDRSQCPRLSKGFLSADISASATSISLLPVGIGSTYNASGYVTIGGNEVVSYTRSGDAMTIVRAQLGSIASTHKAQDRVQLVANYVSNDVADIIDDLLRNYADVPASYLSLAEWQLETATFLGSLYTANICEPTSVATLVSELIEQAALAMWDDNVAQKVRLRVLRGVVTDAFTFTPENYLQGSLTLKEQPERRLSRVQVYFGQIDPTKPLSNLDNYRSTSLSIDEDAETDYGSAAIKTITSRWIPQAGRTVADRLGTIQLGRFRDPPRRVGFATARYASTDVELGTGYRVESFCAQDATGAQAAIPIQVSRLNPAPDRFVVEAEEMLYSAPVVDLTDRQIVFDANNYNINLRSSHDSIYPAPVSGDEVTCTINAGVIIGSVAASLVAFDVGSWPAGVTLNLIINGRIQAAGGAAGPGGASAFATGFAGVPGAPGGTALYTRYPLNLELPPGGELWAGGGGGGGGGGAASATTDPGGGGGGGGGAGQIPGSGGAGGATVNFGAGGGAGAGASATAGGAAGAGGVSSVPAANGGAGGAGGGPGVAGAAGGGGGHLGTGTIGGAPGAGGAAGSAIDGNSFVTTTVSGGDSRGGLVN